MDGILPLNIYIAKDMNSTIQCIHSHYMKQENNAGGFHLNAVPN
jgi:hypothetical protein